MATAVGVVVAAVLLAGCGAPGRAPAAAAPTAQPGVGDAPAGATASPDGRAARVWRDGALGAGTGALLLKRPDAGHPLVVVADADGVGLHDPATGAAVGRLRCPPTTAGPDADAAGAVTQRTAPPVMAALDPDDGPPVVAVVVGRGATACPEGPSAVHLLDVADPRTPALLGIIDAPDGVRALAAHPDGRHLVVTAEALAEGRGTARILDVADPAAPRQLAAMALGNGVAADGAAFSADGAVLYTTAATHAVVHDTTDLAAPARIGQVADPMVRNYWQVEALTVADPVLGARDLFVVRSRIDGLDCPTGHVHVYDVTDELFWTPAVVAEADVPDVVTTMRAPAPLHGCGGPVVRVHAAPQTMTVAVSDARLPLRGRLPGMATRTAAGVVQAALVPYDSSEAFLAGLERCALVRTS